MTGNVQLYLPDGNRKAVPTPDGGAHSGMGVRGQGRGKSDNLCAKHQKPKAARKIARIR